MKIISIKKDKTHSGKLDTQLFPECKDTDEDRDVVKKHLKKKNKSASVAFEDTFELIVDKSKIDGF